MKATKALFGILTITAALALQVHAQNWLTNGLIAYYPFNGNANDESGNGNGGIANGPVLVADRFGKPNSAYSFNGTNDYIRVTRQVTKGQPFTWTVWLRPKLPGTNVAASVMNQGGNPGQQGDSPELDINGRSAGTLALWTYSTVGFLVLSESRAHWDINHWYHLVVTSDASGNRCLYVDGVCEGTATGQVFGQNFTNLYIGGMVSYSGGYFAGSLDDIRIYNRAFSSNEVAQLYAFESQPPLLTHGLVAYYPFNGNANDASGNGHDGTVSKATLVADVQGIPNRSYQFNGSNSFITVPDSPDLRISSNFTVSSWVKIANLRQSGSYIVSKAIWGIQQWGTHYNVVTNQVSFSGTRTPSDNALPRLSAPDNLWHMVTFTCANGSFRAYEDGVDSGQTAPGISLDPVVGGKLWMGATHWDAGTAINYYSGALDQVRIYNRALSASEVQQLYAYESAGSVPLRTATASAALSYDFVVAANITDGGYGYTNTPTVRIIGGGGSGAQAVAVVSNGVVIAVNVLDAGSGYTSAPVVVIDPPFIPNPVLDIAPMSFLSFYNLTPGGVYQLQQSVGWYWSNQPVSFTATNTLYTQMVEGVAGSGDYRLALNPVPAQAFATAVVSYGFVVHATVTSGGSGYVTSPAVTIVGGGGTNATAVVQISGGVVTGIAITSNGTGYTNAPTVRIAPPPAASVSPTVLPVMRVDSANLAPYDNYQIQFKPDLGGTWGNWNGGSFSPTDVTNSQYLFITNGVSFFRLQYVP